jgi:hypothetical protein
MSRAIRTTTIFFAIFAWSVAALSQQEATSSSLSSGWAKVIELKGEVQVQLPTQSLVPASREMILPSGSSIQTKKGSVLLSLQDGSEVLVKGNSSVLLKSPTESDHRFFEVLVGKIRAAVKKRLQGAPSFRLGTPTAVITVRGTQFEVAVKKNLSTEVTVYEGLVEVAGVGYQGAPRLLGPGFFINVPPTGVPSHPRRMIQNDDSLQRGDGREDDRYNQQTRNRTTEDDRLPTSRTGTSSGEHEGPED